MYWNLEICSEKVFKLFLRFFSILRALMAMLQITLQFHYQQQNLKRLTSHPPWHHYNKASGALYGILSRGIFWGCDPTSVEILSKFSKIVEILFSQKRGFFRNFRDVSTYNTPKITFYCIFINKFPKNFEKSAQKFFAAPSAPRKTHFRRLRRRKCGEIPQFFRPDREKSPPPFEGSPPQYLWLVPRQRALRQC